MFRRKLNDVISDAKSIIVNALTDYVRENGEEMNQYFRDEFGMDVDEEDGAEIISVLDFFNNKGCVIVEQFVRNVPELCDVEEVTPEIIDNTFCTNAFYSFYLVQKEDGTEALRYYCLFSNGIGYNDDISEPDHGDADDLSLAVLEDICKTITETF